MWRCGAYIYIADGEEQRELASGVCSEGSEGCSYKYTYAVLMVRAHFGFHFEKDA